jgi:membrane fusion protein, multidrug efflux system
MPEKLISILLLLGLAACAKQPAQDTSSANSGKSTSASSSASSSGSSGSPGRGALAPPTPVHVILAKRQDVPVTFQANANVQALSNIELHPQLVSTISRVHVNEGQLVKAGQVLFSLDDKADQANLAKVRAQLARNEALLQDLQRQHQRSLQLVAQKFVTQSNADSLGSQVQAQQALLQSDKAAIQAAQVNAGYAQVRSPIDGRVGEIKVFPGSLVQLATPLLTVTQINPINLSFTVPESVLPALLAAQKAGPVPVQAKAGGERGKLVFIDSAVDSQTGTVRVKAQFDNREQKWWPGQYAGVEMVVGVLKDAVVLPQDALITSVHGQFVYTVEPGNSVKNRPVKVLHSFGQQMAVSGLQGGEKVVLQGKQNLRPGGKVQPVQEKAESKAESKTESKAEASATVQKGGT